MNHFNTRLVEVLDYLNKFLALVFLSMAAFRFWDMVGDNPVAAVFETLAVVAAGILTCGYLALMLNINRNIETLSQAKQNDTTDSK